MGLFSGGLTFGSFFVYQIVGLIFGWANFRVGLLSGVYGTIFLNMKNELFVYRKSSNKPPWGFIFGEHSRVGVY